MTKAQQDQPTDLFFEKNSERIYQLKKMIVEGVTFSTIAAIVATTIIASVLGGYYYNYQIEKIHAEQADRWDISTQSWRGTNGERK